MADGKKPKDGDDAALLYRSFGFDERAAADDGTIAVSLSSETPVPRWDGLEILDHSAGAIDMSRAKRGLPLLLDHSTRQQIGRIEQIAVKDGKLRGTLRFSKSPSAQEVKQDVLDGIRQEVSVGYHVLARQLESQTEQETVYRVTRWMPLEGSLVAVPADETVGVGRQHPAVQAPAPPAPVPEVRAMSDEKPVDTIKPVDLTTILTEERARVRQIQLLGQQHNIPAEKIEDLLTSGASVDAARAAFLDLIKGRVVPLRSATAEITPGERKPYSFCRALLAAADGDWSKAGYEREVAQELAKHAKGPDGRSAYTPAGFMMPIDMGILELQQRAGLDSKTTSAGLELKFIEPGSFIELLRNSTKVLQLGATYMPGLQGNVAFPRQTGAGTFSWVAENPGSDVGESNLTLDQVTISPKLGQSTSSYSRNLLTQAVVDVEQMVRQDLAMITAIAIDAAAINGTGASNQPKGILSQTGVGAVTLGTNGGTISWNNLVDVVKTVEAANALRGRLAWLTTPGQRAQMSKIAQISATTGIPVWWQGEVDGFRAEASTNVPSNLTKGTSTTICHAIIFGNWQELLVGQWNALDIIVDPYRLKKQGMIEITMYVSIDIAVRHGPSFCAITDAL
jgi:HK97 family phage major capsid protein/HK97 family phage prohead protease